MTSQDDLALLKQMYQRGEISDEQYDVLRRHVLWGTPLPQLMDDVPAPRAEPRPEPPAPPAPRADPDPPAYATPRPTRYTPDPTRYAPPAPGGDPYAAPGSGGGPYA
ncbi:MAG TPA: SHOCT domain-containing protein, partial [Mycobacteriales bacterium]